MSSSVTMSCRKPLIKIGEAISTVEMTPKAVSRRKLSIRKACQTFHVSECCYRYEHKLSDENSLIAKLLLWLTQAQCNWGFGLCSLYLRNVKGYAWNHKRMYEFY